MDLQESMGGLGGGVDRGVGTESQCCEGQARQGTVVPFTALSCTDREACALGGQHGVDLQVKRGGGGRGFDGLGTGVGAKHMDFYFGHRAVQHKWPSPYTLTTAWCGPAEEGG